MALDFLIGSSVPQFAGPGDSRTGLTSGRCCGQGCPRAGGGAEMRSPKICSIEACYSAHGRRVVFPRLSRFGLSFLHLGAGGRTGSTAFRQCWLLSLPWPGLFPFW